MGTTAMGTSGQTGTRAWAAGGGGRARGRSGVRLLGSALLLLVASAAGASPSFDLHISTGGVEEIAVGETLQLVVYRPHPTCLPTKYVGAARAPRQPAEMRLVWSVEPKDVATVTNAGLLTALKAGAARIRVECRDPDSPGCRMTAPGQTTLYLRESVPAGRLPHLEGKPAVERFALAWRADEGAERPRLALSLVGGAFAWSAVITAAPPSGQAFPWVLETLEDPSWFEDDDGVEDAEATRVRWRGNLTSARLTILSWADGVASGRVEAKSSRGVEIDLAFRARLEDREGVLARAAGGEAAAK